MGLDDRRHLGAHRVDAPPLSDARIVVCEHELTRGLDDFTVLDERYCDLQLLGDSERVAEHTHATRTFPTAWTRQYGGCRVACSVLGHDERSYDAPSNRELVRRMAAWAAKNDTSSAAAVARNGDLDLHPDDRTPVTLVDVARAAGLSMTTASRVLNGSDRTVGEEYRGRILAAAESLGYRPNRAAQSMARAAHRLNAK